MPAVQRPSPTAKQAQLLLDYQTTFLSETGRRVLYDIMKRCHVLGSTVMKEPHMMAFKEGERNSALTIMAYCNVDVASMLRLIEEERGHAQFAGTADTSEES